VVLVSQPPNRQKDRGRVMPPVAILEIIRLSLELAIKIIDGIPEDVRQEQARQIWEDHKKLMAFIRGDKA
jgi:hypothetical protein